MRRGSARCAAQKTGARRLNRQATSLGCGLGSASLPVHRRGSGAFAHVANTGLGGLTAARTIRAESRITRYSGEGSPGRSGGFRSARTASPAGPASASRRLPEPSTTRGRARDGGCHCTPEAAWRRGRRSVEARPASADATTTIQYRVCGIRAWRRHNGQLHPTFQHLRARRRTKMTNLFVCLRPQRSAAAAR